MSDQDRRTEDLHTLRQERAYRGLMTDAVMIARCGHTQIWQTEKTGSNDCPWDLPPADLGQGLYRGFVRDRLQFVLQTGLDVVAQTAFYAHSATKAWGYPSGRQHPAMMVFDQRYLAHSWIKEPSDPDPGWDFDKALYPHDYINPSGRRVHTRFARDERSPGCFGDEEMYGFWIPGNALEALIAVVLGGPREDVVALLQGLDLDPRVEFIL
ncbi:hypothetical protein [Mycobacteroides abscessus]|uniref:hypothetical protein n=1 Tax=Mycobacteroides abscessus TaxID=36809 RepID=UPI0009A89FFB|nr:hypothetical protein [Mycobacteroides abscessus]SLH41557.1 Uncharacterised protein [Mycobacteroides abscessus subsp. massiliense]